MDSLDQIIIQVLCLFLIVKCDLLLAASCSWEENLSVFSFHCSTVCCFVCRLKLISKVSQMGRPCPRPVCVTSPTPLPADTAHIWVTPSFQEIITALEYLHFLAFRRRSLRTCRRGQKSSSRSPCGRTPCYPGSLPWPLWLSVNLPSDCGGQLTRRKLLSVEWNAHIRNSEKPKPQVHCEVLGNNNTLKLVQWKNGSRALNYNSSYCAAALTVTQVQYSGRPFHYIQ